MYGFLYDFRAIYIYLVVIAAHRDLAMKLAEEFLDFKVLLWVCTEKNDKQRIYDYMHQFNKDGFPEFVFETFYKDNRQVKIN